MLFSILPKSTITRKRLYLIALGQRTEASTYSVLYVIKVYFPLAIRRYETDRIWHWSGVEQRFKLCRKIREGKMALTALRYFRCIYVKACQSTLPTLISNSKNNHVPNSPLFCQNQCIT